MTKQPNDSYLKDIIDSSSLIVEYIKNLNFQEFENDTMRFLAVSFPMMCTLKKYIPTFLEL